MPISTDTILRTLAAKVAKMRALGMEPKGLLVSTTDYDTLKDELVSKGVGGNPDRLALTTSGTPYPLYTPDSGKVSIRTGQPQEPMVIY